MNATTHYNQTIFDAAVLQLEALEFEREYFGSKLQPKRPRIGITTFTPRFIWKRENDECRVLVNPTLPNDQLAVSCGEEASHYWHHQENRELTLIIGDLGRILEREDLTEKGYEDILIEFAKARNLQEIVGRLGGLEFLKQKGGNPEAYSKATTWLPENHPARLRDIQHETGYTLAQEIMNAGTPPLKIRRKLIRCATLREAVQLTRPYRIEQAIKE